MDERFKYGARDKHMETRMENTINLWVANPFITFEELTKLAGIGVTTFARYRENKEFMDEYHKRCKEKVSDMDAMVVAQLESGIKNGDKWAVKYVADYLGYAAEQKVSLKSDTIINIVVTDEQEGE